MGERHEQRRLPRTSLPWRISARVRDVREVRVLDLSVGGTRLEHLGLLRPGARCEILLPTMLGGLTLSAHVAWCTVVGRRRGYDGERHLLSQTGLRFSALTAAQHAALAGALQRVTTRRLTLDRRLGSA
jgi:hypothetical protein